MVQRPAIVLDQRAFGISLSAPHFDMLDSSACSKDICNPGLIKTTSARLLACGFFIESPGHSMPSIYSSLDIIPPGSQLQ